MDGEIFHRARKSVREGKFSNNGEERLLHSLAEVAQMMGVSVKLVRSLCNGGGLPSIYIGRRRMIARRDLLRTLGLE